MTADVNVTEKVARAIRALVPESNKAFLDWVIDGDLDAPAPPETTDRDRAAAALSALADPDVQAGIAGAMQRAMHDIGLVLLDAEADRLAAAAVERLRGEQA